MKVLDNGSRACFTSLMDTTRALPATGWGTHPITGNPTFTVHGPSWNVHPPALDGFKCRWVSVFGIDYTTWSYRPREVTS